MSQENDAVVIQSRKGSHEKSSAPLAIMACILGLLQGMQNIINIRPHTGYIPPSSRAAVPSAHDVSQAARAMGHHGHTVQVRAMTAGQHNLERLREKIAGGHIQVAAA